MTKVLEGRTRKYAMLGKPSGSNVSGRKKKAMSDSLVSNKMRWPPRWLSDKESTSQCRRCRRHGFDPGGGKFLWSRKWQPAPVFLPGESHRQRSLVDYRP